MIKVSETIITEIKEVPVVSFGALLLNTSC